MSYAANTVEVVITDDAHGKHAHVVDSKLTEYAAGASVTVHKRDLVDLEKAKIAEAKLAVANAIPNQAGVNGAAFSYTIPANTFSGGTSSDVWSATKSDDTALPGWMSFNATTRVLSGTAATGTTSVKIKRTSPGGQVITDTFDVVIAAE